MNPILYVKVGLAAALLAAIFGFGFHWGGSSAKAALEADHAAMAQATTEALIAQRTQQAAEMERDHATEATHAQVILSIDATPPVRTPVFLCGPSPLRTGTVPGAESETSGIAPDPAEWGGERVDRKRDIRPGVEALKRQLEKVMADYRQEDAEWQQR